MMLLGMVGLNALLQTLVCPRTSHHRGDNRSEPLNKRRKALQDASPKGINSLGHPSVYWRQSAKPLRWETFGSPFLPHGSLCVKFSLENKSQRLARLIVSEVWGGGFDCLSFRNLRIDFHLSGKNLITINLFMWAHNCCNLHYFFSIPSRRCHILMIILTIYSFKIGKCQSGHNPICMFDN